MDRAAAEPVHRQGLRFKDMGINVIGSGQEMYTATYKLHKGFSCQWFEVGKTEGMTTKEKKGNDCFISY